MIIIITGATHTGKTALAQRMIEEYKYPCVSLDLLKMGLIRSGQTTLTPDDDRELVGYLWNITKEIIKTAIENEQNLIIEGCYIPYDWTKDFSEEYLKNIKYICLAMSEEYIKTHFDDIKKYANVIEKRLDDSYFTIDIALRDNAEAIEMCKKHGLPYVLIDEEYKITNDSLV